VIRPEIRASEDFAPAFAAIKGRADALYVNSDVLTITNRTYHASTAWRGPTAMRRVL
jgi:hypothetical protein